MSKETCVLNGIAGWFEAVFKGSRCDVVLSTSPWDVLTHWWQTRLMFPEPLAVNMDQQITGQLKFTATKSHTYQCELVMEANGVKRHASGLDLLDMDVGHRTTEFRVVEVGPPEHRSHLRIVDYAATRSKGQFSEILVSDPLRRVKEAAAQSQLAAPIAGPPHEKPWGSQIKVRDQFYLLANEPATLEQWTKPGTALVQYGDKDAAGSTWLTPAESQFSLMIEYAPGKEGDESVMKRLWLEKNTYMQHMQKFIMTSPVRNQNVTDAQILGMDIGDLYQAYDKVREATGVMPKQQAPAA
eukprot:gnl/TRDRNA2_/TRDRNA2_125943_c3_seq1.p1 gnl/TRDRNA2_/TRDRNA2_125943_c3~~gnl/TRDRNA2_/TRDRNA2_125943_c3_seq1.p1  ORF type:complete len:307 (-),score=48.46 gnl/TRDRNA2_/TRDRNA2_125943_c3_seq1:66-959(-)